MSPRPEISIGTATQTNPPPPKRKQVRLRAAHIVLYFELGEGPAKITDGLGGWVEVPRPGLQPITRWEGGVSMRMQLPLMLDGYADRKGVERDLRFLWGLGRRRKKDKRPPPFKLHGAVLFSGMRWVIESTPEQDREIWSRDGRLLRTHIVLPLLEYEPGDRIKFTRKGKGNGASGGGDRDSYTVKRDENLRQIAAKLKPDREGNEVSRYARDIGHLNGIRDIRRTLNEGRELRLP